MPLIWPDLSETPVGAREGSSDVAVIVAIEDYAELEDVAGATRNAQDWLAWFTRTRGIPAHHVYKAWDRDAKDIRIKAIVDEAARAAPSDGTLWFVFIGHGAPSKDGKDGLLVGVDADRSADGIYGRSLARTELLMRLDAGKQRNTIAIIDACFSGQGSSGASLVPSLQPVVPTALLDTASRARVMTATSSGEFSGPLTGATRPAFSYLMLGALAGWADGATSDPDGAVSLAEARDWTAGALNLTTSGRTQTPRLSGDDLVIGKAWRRNDIPDLVGMLAPNATPSYHPQTETTSAAHPTNRPKLTEAVPTLLRSHGVSFLPLEDTVELADAEVTQGLWRAVMRRNPSAFFACGDDCPVEGVTLDDALTFCNLLSIAEKRVPAYVRGKHGWERVRGANGYRLPTAHEWQVAAGGGATSYPGSDLPNSVAWTRANAKGVTHPVRELRPSGGWFDLAGNVAEHVFGDAGPGSCGGSWDDPPLAARVDACAEAVSTRASRSGLRLARQREP